MRLPAFCLCLLSLLAAVLPAAGQAPDSLAAVVVPGSRGDERARFERLGQAPSGDAHLLRSTSRLTLALEGSGFRLLAPDVRAVWNSDLPYSLNEGAMWAGRGRTTQVRAGVQARVGPVSLTLAPQLIHHQNLDFMRFPYPEGDRSAFASPFHTQPESLDLPSRFGSQPYWLLDPGQSSLAVDAGPLRLGASTENLWWGPGIRNAIVLSSNAAGIPQLFLEAREPLATRLGSFDFRWFVGGLTESLFFDTVAANDLRSISAAALTFSPAYEPGLSLGISRAVYQVVPGPLSVPARVLDVFTNVGRPNARPSHDLEREPGADQIFSLFGRWVFPEDRFELYAEWARHEQPKSISDFLQLPNHTQGYTLGLQWGRPALAGSMLRLQAEATYLEMSPTFRHRRVTTYYKSRPVPQGYTQRGQVVGAAIGPGSSSQWLAADLLGESWEAGLFAGRVRWENDVLYSLTQRSFFAHDVSVFGGVRGGVRTRWADASADLTRAQRYNYLFQNLATDFETHEAVDVGNWTLRLSLVPRLF